MRREGVEHRAQSQTTSNKSLGFDEAAQVLRVFSARRSHLAMARLLGPLLVLRFLTRRLTVKQIESKAIELLGCTGGAVRGCAPELAFDIDYPSDYRYVLMR